MTESDMEDDYLDMEDISIAGPMKMAHFELPRAKELRGAFKRCLREYYVSRMAGNLEVRGLVVTGESRVGKTREMKKLIGDFNKSETLMPDGRPGKIVSCLLSGRVTYKDLGIATLKALGYDIQGTRTQVYIWERVLFQAEQQGVIGIHYDECQHVFRDGGKTNQHFLDSFKSMMKETRWPLMMILSGVPSLNKYIRSHEQLDNLVEPVRFHEINVKRDEEYLARLLYLYADQVEINIEQLVTQDFLTRLDYACSHRWGLVIELLIETLIEAKLKKKKQLRAKDFAKEFALKTGTREKYSPFTAPDFREAFDSQKLLELQG
ncbi:TniB family NTP-binding protein [Tateyamaria pelophila]|uniref:TniB family NTP-binding protein n=1 Tax=Tateyamaria pelophila TaxID=328415 RepID=UPI001CBECA64|nr:TniB family NTP-binding protein [Tateyamaria pelophila]